LEVGYGLFTSSKIQMEANYVKTTEHLSRFSRYVLASWKIWGLSTLPQERTPSNAGARI